MVNAQAISNYKKLNNIPQQAPLFTFGEWKKKGYIVKKGEKSRHRLRLYHYNEEKEKFILKNAYLFTQDQVEKIV